MTRASDNDADRRSEIGGDTVTSPMGKRRGGTVNGIPLERTPPFLFRPIPVEST